MAYEFYVTIEGTKQGKFKGESIRDIHKEKLAGLSFNYKVTAPIDTASGAHSGKRRHEPIEFVKEVGASSPQIFQALVTNEVIKSVLFEFIRTTPEGAEEIHYTIKLLNASISSYQTYIEADSKHSESHDVHELERIAFTFRRIELESKLGKTSAIDDWTK
ncbi:MAG: type VI secretion system tube protein TssD [Polyangiales bacterium]